MFEFPEANSYGLVLINAKGEVLLVEPTGHFGGYHWTFPKARRQSNETPEQAVLRAGSQDGGYRIELICVLPKVYSGTTGTAAYALAGPYGAQFATSSEVSATKWVCFDAARELITHTQNPKGRDRDLAVLEAACIAHEALPWSQRPGTCKEDWATQELPPEHAMVPLDMLFSQEEMARIRKGLLPWVQEQKWFLWFDAPLLHIHRSWTGICYSQVMFVPEGDTWRAVVARVNRNLEQYSETDDAADAIMIRNLVTEVARHIPDVPQIDTMAEALMIASQPNYLGSPKVVRAVLETVIEIAIEHFRGESDFNGVWNRIWDLSQEVSNGDTYQRMPGWHTSKALGKTLVQALGVRDEPIFADDLGYFVSEAFMALFFKVRDLLRDFEADPNAAWDPHGLTCLNALHEWATQVFLGSHVLQYEGVRLSDFTWKAISDEP